MNINNTTPAVRHVHRVYVVVPLFALVCALSSYSAVTHMERATPAQVAREQGDMLIDTAAVRGSVSIAHTGDSWTLSQGTALIAARSLVRVEAAGFTCMAWNGAFELVVEDAAIVVAALTTPVVIRMHERTWIVPAHMQLRIMQDDAAQMADAAKRAMPLPAHYLAERLPAAEDLQQHVPPHQMLPIPLVSPIMGQLLRLPAARVHAQEADERGRVHMLANALSAGDAQEARALLEQPEMQAALRAPHLYPLLPRLLSDAEMVDMQRLILPYAVADGTMRLLVLYHPDVRAHAWLLPWDGVHERDMVNALSALPHSDRGAQALPDLAVESWGMAWNAVLSTHADASTVVDAVLPHLQHDIQALHNAGFPERARRYARQLQAAIAPYSSAAIRIADTLQEPVADPVVVPEARQFVPETDAVPSPEEAQRLVHAARQALAEAGAMFTANTRFQALPGERVQVDDVVFATAAGDKLLSFVYQRATGMVVDILHDGQRLPYDLLLSAYLQWVGTQH